MPLPTLQEVRDRIGVPATLVSDAELQQYYDTELELFAAYLIIPEDSAAFTTALCRAVAHDVAMKAIPLGLLSDEFGTVRAPSVDYEVQRLVAPYYVVPIA